jgi:hypothetical protein
VLCGTVLRIATFDSSAHTYIASASVGKPTHAWFTMMLQVSEMVYEEAVRCGKVLGIAVPVPGEEVWDGEGCRVYVKFAASGEAAKCKEMMDGRLFDDNKVRRKTCNKTFAHVLFGSS